MSILVRGRRADLEKDPSIYSMSDAAMLDQVVCIYRVRNAPFEANQNIFS
jgi:hypothetical protein